MMFSSRRLRGVVERLVEMDPLSADGLVVDDEPVGRTNGACPHCGRSSTLCVFVVRETIFRTRNGAILICDDCGGYAANFTLLRRAERLVRFSGALTLSLVMPIAFGYLIDITDGWSLREIPPLNVVLPVAAIMGLSAVGAVWSAKGILHTIRAGPIVALTKRFSVRI
jgi:hypothetical protein